MKRKDFIYLILAAVIFLVAGYLAYTQLLPKKSGTDTAQQVERVDVVPQSFNQADLAKIGDATQVRNYSSPVDLGGLNNTAPFGP